MTSARPALYGAHYTSRRAVLVLNLGSPDSPEVKDVATYLHDFLTDRRVVGLSRPIRLFLVDRIIIPRRAPRSAENYRTIWDAEEKTFPLIAHTASIADQLSRQRQCPVAVGMRYGNPSTAEALCALAALPSVEELVIAPLYPHYAQSSYETAVAFVLEELERLKLRPLKLSLLPAFYDAPEYRSVLADHVREHLPEHFDRLVVSMHGIPTSHLHKACRARNGHTSHCLDRREWHESSGEGDCYRLHSEATRHALAEDLSLPQRQVELVYQSRLGFHPWLQPYMSRRVGQFASEGVEHLVVVCPGFVCDCLETIQEIDDYYRGRFLSTGGKQFSYIPCLNSSPAFVSALSTLIDKTFADPSCRLSTPIPTKYQY